MFAIFTRDQEVNWLWKLFNSMKFNVITHKLPTNLISSGRVKTVRIYVHCTSAKI